MKTHEHGGLGKSSRRRPPGGSQESTRLEGRSSRFRWQVAAIWVIAFAVRLAYIWQIRPSPFFEVLMGDARGYDSWAQQIAGGDWIGQEVFYQAPLYPYFLGTIYSIAGHDLLFVRVCQAMIGAAGCVFLALAGRRLYSESVGWIAGLGLAIYAPAIFFDGLLQKSVLDLFFVSLVLWLLSGLVDNRDVRSRWFSVGLALGGLALTRENALVLIAPILLWRLLPSIGSWRSGTRRLPTYLPTIVAFALGLLLVLSPVAARNQAIGGEWHITTSQFGPNFYLGNNADADGTAVALREGRGSVEYERQDATDLAEAAEGRNLTPGEVSTFWTNKAVAFIRYNPWAWLKLVARKVILLGNATELIDTESQESYEEWSPVLRIAAQVGHFGVLAPLAIFGVFAAWRDRRRLGLFYALAATYAASVVMFYVSARYRLPLVPFLMLFAAAGLGSLPSFLRAAGRIRRAGTAAGVIAIAIVVNWPLWPAGLMRAVTENNLANALQTGRRFREAESHYNRAIQIRPDYAPAYVNLGETLLAQDRPEEALDAYRRASAFATAGIDLDARMGIALFRAGKPSDAVSYLQQALAEGQSSAEIYINLTASLIAVGRHEEAITIFGEALERNPNSSDLHFRFGTLLLERNRLAEAITELRAGLALDPDSPQGHGNLGVALAASGRKDEAIVEFEQALRLNPSLVSARRNLEIARREMARPPVNSVP